MTVFLTAREEFGLIHVSEARQWVDPEEALAQDYCIRKAGAPGAVFLSREELAELVEEAVRKLESARK